MKAIQTLSLTKVFKNRVACDQIHLTVNQGEIFGLLGPNGAGKSTLVKMLVGLVNPSAGSARVLGFSFREMQPRRQIGYLPELFRYQPWLTALEVLGFHAYLLGKNPTQEQRAMLLGQVGLKGRGHERVRSFSKGMQQRLGLAVALIGDPRLVFLDEPSSALDPVGRYEVGEILKGLRAQGVTVFLNSHLLSDVEKLCDSVALIDHGQVLYQGGLEDAMYGEARRYRIQTRGLGQETAMILTQQFQAVIEWGKGLAARVLVTLNREDLPVLHALLAEHNVAVYEVEPDHSSLEHWFLSRLGKDPG